MNNCGAEYSGCAIPVSFTLHNQLEDVAAHDPNLNWEMLLKFFS
jgi:hypothetical protein